MALIKNGILEQNTWQHVGDDESLPQSAMTVSLKRWKAEKEDLLARNLPLGLRLNSEDAPEEMADEVKHFSLIVLEFTHFTDGRAFSQARLLRERFNFTGELRVRGNYLRDQVFFLSRVGVNAFELPDTNAVEDLLAALHEFSVKYQAAVDIPKPLYRHR
jgi:uncharacterized protein (DUF934 family)